MGHKKKLKLYRKELRKHFEKMYPDFFVFCKSLGLKHRLNIAFRIVFIKKQKQTKEVS